MKLIYYSLVLLLFSGTVMAQQLYPTTVSSGGNSSSNGAVLLESSVGGLVVTTISTPNFIYTQGFLQPDAGNTTVIPIINDVVLNSGAGLDNAGTTFINGNIMLEFTLGEYASITLNNTNQMLTQGILQPFNSAIALPVTGLEFYAKRLNKTTVQLDWKTMQEINNRGFHLERKFENENSFREIAFIPSAASGGNSNFSLEYQHPDNNNFNGKTFYRIKQEDVDGRSSYSYIRIVAGAGDKQTIMQVWPVPSTGPVNVLVNGLTKPDVLMVFDMSGKMVKQQVVQNNIPVQVNNLTAGTYILRLAENKGLEQKVVMW